MARPWWRLRRVWVPVATLLLAAVGVYVFVWLPSQPAIRFFRGLAAPEIPAAEFRRRATWTDDSFTLGPGGGGELRPTIVVVHGVTEDGVRDPRLWRLADSLESAGFTVHVPEIPGMKRMGNGDAPPAARAPPDPAAATEDAARVRRAIEDVVAGHVPGADGRRVGLLGVSLGGAIALRAAASGGAASAAVRALLLVGAPDDTSALAREWFRRRDAPPGAQGEAASRADMARFARLAGLRLALPSLVPTEDAAPIRAWLRDPPRWRLSAFPSGAALATAEGRRFVAAASAGPDVGEADLAWLIDGAARGGLDSISPAAWGEGPGALPGLRAPCFLIHGVADPLVSISELDRLATRLSRRTRVRTLASGLLEHVGVASPGLVDGWIHVRFVQAFFDAVAD